jgi:hypothetical protein
LRSNLQALPNLKPLHPDVLLPLQAKLNAAEAELDSLKAMISAARERDAFRLAYRHEASLNDRFAAVALRAQCWPRDMQDVFNR